MKEGNNPNRKMMVMFLLALLVVWTIIIACFLLMASGQANISIKSFAVDSAGNLYVGVSRKILVYSDGNLIRSFSSKTSRDFVFTITEDDIILLTTSSRQYVMDLHGNVLNYGDKYIGAEYPELQDDRTLLELPNGDRYAIKDTLGWTRIVKNNTTVVYQISALSFLVKMLLYFAVISFLIFLSRLFKKLPLQTS